MKLTSSSPAAAAPLSRHRLEPANIAGSQVAAQREVRATPLMRLLLVILVVVVFLSSRRKLIFLLLLAVLEVASSLVDKRMHLLLCFTQVLLIGLTTGLFILSANLLDRVLIAIVLMHSIILILIRFIVSFRVIYMFTVLLNFLLIFFRGVITLTFLIIFFVFADRSAVFKLILVHH